MTTCRTCKSERLYLFLPLGDHPLANGFLRKEQLAEPEERFPLEVHVCLDCGLIQVADQVPAGYFRHYVYIPSAADAMHDHFAGLAESIQARFLRSPDALTVDIGCNDGLFLSFLRERGARGLGIDPATNIVQLARDKGVEVVNEYFTPDLARLVRDQHGPAKVVVSTNTFHHIGDLDPFTLGVTLMLDEHGVFVVEVPHALELVEQNEFDGVYHEHVSQHTVKSFVDHFRLFGLEVFDVERLDIHGGSIRVFARRATSGATSPPVVREWLDEEARRGLFVEATYDAFRVRVERIREELLQILAELKAEGKRIVGYGASARGNTLLNYYGIGTETLDYIVDRNPLKEGLYSPGMHIPVEGAKRLADDDPDYVLVIAWNFAEEIARQQAEYVKRGGRFIVPIPEPRIVS
ncbi:MAG: methyltransferase domain-containing protein [Actinobacteria bacterium]|nr:methyltransferase domain-containing protein [Actinomycetota bacterium]